MIDPIKILQRAWHILWNYRTLWIFGLLLALAAGGTTSGGGNNGFQYQTDNNGSGPQIPPPQSMQEFFDMVSGELEELFREGIPDVNITGEGLTAFLWAVGVFVLFLIILGVAVTIAYYVAENAVIRMVDEYENTGTRMSVREGFRIGWSRGAWRLFLINLIVHLPVILLLLVLLVAGVMIFLATTRGDQTFAAVSVIGMIGLVFTTICAVIVLSVFLRLLRNFFWRVAVLEDVGVGESLRRGFAMVREQWKSVGLMWLVMIGLGIAWIFVSIIAFFLMIPVVIVTTIIAILILAIPAMLLFGLFSLFMTGPLPWIAAGLFVLPLFALIAFSPWWLLGSWQSVFTSTVWTLTYREIKALPAVEPQAEIIPVGD